VLTVSCIRNAKGYLIPEVKMPEECSGCLNCEMICPDMAITVEGDENEK
jgi:2-oxoglutarate ferredoxin oxidoreductase subunit delta